jgi:hypothetical protein
MEMVTLDPELKARLNGLNQQLHVCDEDGQPLGVFLPLEDYKKLLAHKVQIPFSEEEIAQLRSQKQGRSLAEIWKDLGVSRNTRWSGRKPPKNI